MDKEGRSRYKGIVIAFLGISLIWGVYLFSVQMLDPHRLTEASLARYTPTKIIDVPKRGDIYDRYGNLLVGSAEYYQLDLDCAGLVEAANRRGEDPDSLFVKVANVFATYTDLQRDQVLEKMRQHANGSIMVSNKIPEICLTQIADGFSMLDLKPPSAMLSQCKRIYHKGPLAARILGMVKQDDNWDKNNDVYPVEGYSGLELAMEDDLKGHFGWKKTMLDAHSRELTYLQEDQEPAQDGANIELTLDSDFQAMVERQLAQSLRDYSAQNAIAVFMDVNSGEVLVMACVSKLELDRGYPDSDDAVQFSRSLPNNVISFMYEPGSTFKPFAALSALDNNVCKPTDMFDCSPWAIGGRVIRDSHTMGALSLVDVMVHSSNVGIAKIADRVGATRYYKTIVDMGFGSPTGVGLPGETGGLLRKLPEWSGYSLHSISFGQEVCVTPLQIVTAYCAIANGGRLYKPLLWRRMLDDSTRVTRENRPVVQKVISNTQNLAIMRDMLRQVVARGTAHGTDLPYIQIAGKTGTAERVNEDGRYDKSRYVGSFCGYFPADNPQIAGVVIFDSPSYAYHFGAQCAVPTFKKIVEEYVAMPHSNVIPNLKVNSTGYLTMPSVVGYNRYQAQNLLNQYGIIGDFQILGPGELVTKQYPAAGIQFPKSHTVTIMVGQPADTTLVVAANSYTMPDLRGKSVREANREARRLKIKLLVNGHGNIASQSLAPGSAIRYGQECTVWAQ